MVQMTEKVCKPSTPSSRPNIDRGRNNLMEEIIQGVALKKVDSSALKQEPRDVCENTPGIAGMLQRALQKRWSAMGLSDKEGKDSGDDEEWDD